MAFENFADFLKATREEKLSMDEMVRTVCMKQNYAFSELIRGKDIEKLSQGGTAMKLLLRTSTNGSYRNYAPGDDWAPVAADTLSAVSVSWKFTTVNFSWYEEEDLLNKYGKSSFAELLTDVYEPGCINDFVEGVEAALWAVPNTSTMEASTGNTPYSIPTFVNEYTNTIPTGFSTVMGLSPSTQTNWQNYRAGYSASNLMNVQVTNGLAGAMEDAAISIRFKGVAFGPAKSTANKDNTGDRVLLMTNKDGLKTYQSLLRTMNDRTVKAQDISYQAPQFADEDICWIPTLDTAAIYSSTLSGSHNSGVAATGYPRFYMIHTGDLHPIVNSSAYFKRRDVENGGHLKPNLRVQYIQTFWNLACYNRRTHAIVYPSAA